MPLKPESTSKNDDSNKADDKSRSNNKRIIIKVRNFLLFCSGATIPILLESGDSEISQYLKIGTAIFLTALIASFSGGYAFYTLFKGVRQLSYLSILFGLVWGLFILTIDRLMVSTIKKQKDGSSNQESENQQRTKIVVQALPRFIMAAIVGFIVSKPIELRLFQREIIIGDVANRITQSREDLKKVEDKIEQQTDRRKQEADRETELRKEWRIEASKVPAREVEDAENKINELKKERGKPAQEIADLEEIKAGLEKGIMNDGKVKKTIQEYENLSFFTQYNLMTGNPKLLYISWFITGFFILIELLPTLLKLLFPYSAYDKSLEDRERTNMYRSIKKSEYEEWEIDQNYRNERKNLQTQVAKDKIDRGVEFRQKKREAGYKQKGQDINGERKLDNLRNIAASDSAIQKQILEFLDSEVKDLLQKLKKTDKYKDARDRAMKEMVEQLELKLLDLSQGLSDDVARSAANSVRQAASDQLRSRFQELDGRAGEIETLMEQIVQYLRGHYSRPPSSSPDSGIDETPLETPKQSENARNDSTSREHNLSGSTSRDEQDQYGSISSLNEGLLESPSEGSHNRLVNHDIDGSSSDGHHPSVSTSSRDNRDRNGPLSSSEDNQGNGSTSNTD